VPFDLKGSLEKKLKKVLLRFFRSVGTEKR